MAGMTPRTRGYGKFAGDIASTILAGVVRLATTAETITGTDATIAVTPAGAAGTYAPLPATAVGIPTLGYRAAVGTWSIAATNTLPAIQSQGDGNELTYDFIAKAGTYTLRIGSNVGNNKPKVDTYIDGVLVDSQRDYYNATGAISYVEVTGLTITGTGAHTIRFVINTKNASSANFSWTIGLGALCLLRTGA